MDLKEKVAEALRQSLEPEHMRIEEGDGIYGFIVSARFQRMPALDRQKLIDQVLRGSSVKMTKSELREILVIAALTPVEYASIGPLPGERRR